MLPSPDILNDFQPGRFVLSNLAAKRAKQLKDGAPPLVQVDSNHPLTIALAEIAAGKIKAIMTTSDAEAFDIPETAVLVEETVPGELGMLLPALDDKEAALVTGVVLGDEDHDDHDHDHEVEGLSLADLAGGDEEHEEEHDEVVAAENDDTLSLNDLAEQETQDDEENEE